MKSSCVSHPASEPLVIIRQWQKEFCDGNLCAAGLLSRFEYFHNWKLNTDEYNKKTNDITESHGDPRELNEDVMQYHTLKELSEGLLGLYGEKAIAEAVKLLEEKGAITIHGNPNPKYFYDKTKYFMFHPEVGNEWLKNLYKSRSRKNATSEPQKGVIDPAKRRHGKGENAPPWRKKALPITEINNRDINQSLNQGKTDFEFENEEPRAEADHHDSVDQAVDATIEALIEKGLPEQRFYYPDINREIKRLISEGATTALFLQAYDKACITTQDKGFGVRYLVRVVGDMLDNESLNHNPSVVQRAHQLTIDPDDTRAKDKNVYVTDLTNGKHWLTNLNEEGTTDA